MWKTTIIVQMLGDSINLIPYTLWEISRSRVFIRNVINVLDLREEKFIWQLLNRILDDYIQYLHCFRPIYVICSRLFKLRVKRRIIMSAQVKAKRLNPQKAFEKSICRELPKKVYVTTKMKEYLERKAVQFRCRYC